MALAELAMKSGNSQYGQLCLSRALEMEGMESYRHHSRQLEALQAQLHAGRGTELSSGA